jgi:two-component system, LytTR family, response regulator LytT
MKKTCIIVDDEPEELNRTRITVEQTGLVELIGVCHSPSIAIQEILRQRPDLVILDIQMPEIPGTEAARIIQKNLSCKFIFVTAYPHHALESFDVDVIHYLLKPATYISVYEALTKFLRFVGEEQKPEEKATVQLIKLVPIKKGEPADIRWSEISCVQSQGKISVVFCKDGRQLQVRQSLKAFENVLPEGRFIKAHRSFIVSLDGLREEYLTARCLCLPHTKIQIPVSRQARQFLRQLFQNNKALPV